MPTIFEITFFFFGLLHLSILMILFGVRIYNSVEHLVRIPLGAYNSKVATIMIITHLRCFIREKN